MAHFEIKNRFQRRSGSSYRDILTLDILEDVCQRITGQPNYTVDFDDSGYNIGRLATLSYQNSISYISFSEIEIKSRNSSFQSFPSALVRYHKETNPNKNIYFYFLSSYGNIQTDYFIFMYRLMKTAGTLFLNETEHLSSHIIPFNSIADIDSSRKLNKNRNKGNNSTYITKNENDTWEMYGKIYGANKYETTLLCLAISELATDKIELYEIKEGNLKSLPKLAREVILSLDKFTIITSDLTLERNEFNNNDSLRSPAFVYNLLEKYGDKKCALCECEIPQIIQGAHIWRVADIKRKNEINQEQKLQAAKDGDNGIWLCNNHHKLFDINMFLINEKGEIKYKSNIREIDENYIHHITNNHQIHNDILTPTFMQYLQKRNNTLDKSVYNFVE
ncbi:MAG: HNH endonuclease [bacterium]